MSALTDAERRAFEVYGRAAAMIRAYVAGATCAKDLVHRDHVLHVWGEIAEEIRAADATMRASADAELDLKVDLLDRVIGGAWMSIVEQAHERLKLAAVEYATTRNEHEKDPNPLKLKLQGLIESSFQLSIAVLQMQGDQAHVAKGYQEAIETLERFRSIVDRSKEDA